MTLILFFMLSGIAASAATLTGTITDTMCTKKHMMPGKSDAECARACAQHGGKWALVSGRKVYVLEGDQAKISSAAGKKVTVTGEVKGQTLAVKSIAVDK